MKGVKESKGVLILMFCNPRGHCRLVLQSQGAGAPTEARPGCPPWRPFFFLVLGWLVGWPAAPRRRRGLRQWTRLRASRCQALRLAVAALR